MTYKIKITDTNRGTKELLVDFCYVPILTKGDAKEALKQIALNVNDECSTVGDERRFKQDDPKHFETLRAEFKQIINDEGVSDDAIINLRIPEVILNPDDESFEYDGVYYTIIK